MSQATRHPLADLRIVAEKLRSRLEPACHRIEIAGSIRRKRPLVGDIELVAIPKSERIETGTQHLLFSNRTERVVVETVNRLWAALDRMGVKYLKKGDIYRQFEWEGLPVDLHTCDAGNWGWIFLHRTGPPRLRGRVGTILARTGYGAADGWIWRVDGTSLTRLSTPEEEDVFKLVGIPYTAPEGRDHLVSS